MKIYNKIQGFTLVELAIVMTIIGLLIGGILKGQELLNNARLNTVMRTLQAFPAAVTTFKDIYGAIPGDIINPGTRLANCSGLCATTGDGNGIVDGTDEAATFWLHLAEANLVTGVRKSGTDAYTTGPLNPFGGYFMAVTDPPSSFRYYMQRTESAVHYPVFTPSQAAQIDRKMDDGIPTGDIFAFNNGRGVNACYAGGVYNESFVSKLCFLSYRSQL